MPVPSTCAAAELARQTTTLQHDPYNGIQRPGVQCSSTGTLPVDWHRDRRRRPMDVETQTTLRRKAMSVIATLKQRARSSESEKLSRLTYSRIGI